MSRDTRPGAEGEGERYSCTTEDGWMISLHRYRSRAPPGIAKKNHSVLLCHGFASNRHSFDLNPEASVARYFANEGWDTWIVELRGSGLSEKPSRANGKKYDWCVDDHIKDCQASIALIVQETGASVHLLGHSMGGMILTAMASMNLTSSIRSGVSIGSTIFMEESSWRHYLFMWPILKHLPCVHADFFQKMISPMAVRTNSPWDKLFFVRSNVSASLAREMFSKNWEPIAIPSVRQFKKALDPRGLPSRDGSSFYSDGLSQISIPMLVIAGSKDRQCPPQGAEKMASMIPGARYICLGKQNGQKHSYGHFDLLIGKNAREECWFQVLKFLQENDSYDEMKDREEGGD